MKQQDLFSNNFLSFSDQGSTLEQTVHSIYNLRELYLKKVHVAGIW